jgi:NDP-sugar pyrophosphorylase family protein
MIKAYFNEGEKNYTIEYADEDTPLGTGGGLSLLKGKVNNPFILTNCDILIDADYGKIYDHHLVQDNFITMVCSLKNMKIPYGVVEIGNNGCIEDIKEKPELTFFVNTGMYVVDPSVIEDLKRNEKADFPDIIDKYRKRGKKIGVYPISENSWMDMGQLDEMENMRKKLEG